MDSHWKLIRKFLKNRCCLPWKNPGYVMYFIIIIVIVNSISILKDLIGYHYCLTCPLDKDLVRNFSLNLTNIGLSLITASVIDLVFISRRSIEIETEQERYKPGHIESIKKSVRIFGLCSLIIIFIIWIIVNSFLPDNWWKIIFSSLGLMFSFLIWWISNVRNKILYSDFSVFGTLGKEATLGKDNKGVDSDSSNSTSLSGDVSNFKVD